MSSADYFKIEGKGNEAHFVKADSLWAESNQAAGKDGFPAYTVQDSYRSIGTAFMAPVHWERLVIRDTRKSLQHFLFVLGFWWADHKKLGFMEAWPSVQLIADQTGLSKRTIERHLDAAKREGWLIVAKQTPSYSGHVRNIYYLCVPNKSIRVGLFSESPIVKKSTSKKPKKRQVKIDPQPMRHSGGQVATKDQNSTAKKDPLMRHSGALIERRNRTLKIKREIVLRDADASRSLKKVLEKTEDTPSDTAQESPPSAEVLQEEGQKLIHVAQETDTPLDNYQRLSELSRWTPDEVKQRIRATQP